VRYATLELDTGGPKRGGERRGQKGPPEEALAPEGQSQRNEERVVLSPEHQSKKTSECQLLVEPPTSDGQSVGTELFF
jgi:hypothetical protein